MRAWTLMAGCVIAAAGGCASAGPRTLPDDRIIVPDDAVTAERMQRAFAAAPVLRSAGVGGGRIDLSRGLAREAFDERSGRRAGHVTDETTNRGFWRRYREIMSGG